MVYTPPAAEGDYIVQVQSDALVATTTVRVRAPIGTDIALDVNPARLGKATSATARVIVRDPYGQPAANAQVRVGVEQDGEQGMLGGGEVFTGTTNAQGELTVTFQKAPAAGAMVTIRAELLANDGTRFVVLDEDSRVVSLANNVLFLPITHR